MWYLRKQKEGHKNSSICKQCGGICCHMFPGATFPADFDSPLEKTVSKAIASGLFIIDMREIQIEYDDGEYEYISLPFVRPTSIGMRIKRKDGTIGSGMWHNACIFIGEDGCELDFDDRPTVCRMLEPDDKNCKNHGFDVE